MSKYIIDIETFPNYDVINMLPEPTVALGNIKDVEKIKAKIEVAKNKQISQMALSPLTGKIACIGVYNGSLENVFVGSEKEVLTDFYNIILKDNNELITYNGNGFDIPFIFKRGIILGLEWATILAMKEYTNRYSERHIDLMQEFCDYEKYEKLDTLARFILGDKKNDFDVTKISELIKTKEGLSEIATYCMQDCKITFNLAKRLGFIN